MLSQLPVLYSSEVIQASQLVDFNQTVWQPYQRTVTVVQAMRVWHRTVTRGYLASFLHYVTVDSYHSGCLEYWPWRIWTQDCDTWIPVSCTMWLLTAFIQVAWNIGLEGYGHRTVTREYQFPALCDCWQLSFRLPGILAMRDMTQDCDTWMPVSCTVTVDGCHSGCLEYWLWGIWPRTVTHEYQFPALCDCWKLSFRLPGILAMRDMTQDCDTWIPVSCTMWLAAWNIIQTVCNCATISKSCTHHHPSPIPPPPPTDKCNITIQTVNGFKVLVQRC